MKSLSELQKFFKTGYLEYLPHLTIDCAIFGYHEGQLKLLLVKNKIVTDWCLPGGFIKREEKLDEAAARITMERTGIENLFLKQFKTFGDPGRNVYKKFDEKKFFELTGVNIQENNWLFQHTVSIGFYAITDISNACPEADILSSECAWFPIGDLPELAFDHNEMVKEALLTMRIHLYHFPIGKNMLPEKFTLKEIHLFYETMIGKKLNASNFPNKLISLGLLEKLDEKRNIGAHRSPTFYKFNAEIYDQALREGLVLA
ncbi:MAG TPA: NUDIX domain-containing protein [Mucilaginibacter sp.]|jgi:ADP-ribose pyrophosphatase YjhB (NUDIX family)